MNIRLIVTLLISLFLGVKGDPLEQLSRALKSIVGVPETWAEQKSRFEREIADQKGLFQRQNDKLAKKLPKNKAYNSPEMQQFLKESQILAEKQAQERQKLDVRHEKEKQARLNREWEEQQKQLKQEAEALEKLLQAQWEEQQKKLQKQWEEEQKRLQQEAEEQEKLYQQFLQQQQPSKQPQQSWSQKTQQQELSQEASRDYLEKKIHELINVERTKKGFKASDTSGNLNEVAWDEKLKELARRHSEDMATTGIFNHVLHGLNFWGRYQQAGLPKSGAENIAYQMSGGMGTWFNTQALDILADKIVQGWMNSPGHRKNILTSWLTKEGIGIAFKIGPNDYNEVYATEDFR